MFACCRDRSVYTWLLRSNTIKSKLTSKCTGALNGNEKSNWNGNLWYFAKRVTLGWSASLLHSPARSKNLIVNHILIRASFKSEIACSAAVLYTYCTLFCSSAVDSFALTMICHHIADAHCLSCRVLDYHRRLFWSGLNNESINAFSRCKRVQLYLC